MNVYRRVGALGAGSLVVLALSPTSAIAVAPKVQTVTLHRDFGVVGSCPGFDVTATFDPTRRITTFYNAEGIPISNLLTGATKSTATNVHVIVPGEGTVQLAAGLADIDGHGNLVKQVGRQDPPVTQALCDALA